MSVAMIGNNGYKKIGKHAESIQIDNLLQNGSGDFDEIVNSTKNSWLK